MAAFVFHRIAFRSSAGVVMGAMRYADYEKLRAYTERLDLSCRLYMATIWECEDDPATWERKNDGVHDFALAWYQDEETVWLVDGKRNPYTMERLDGMYHYLDNAGELYFIEVLENGTYKPIGDVTFWQEDMPIVIGDPAYRGKGIGRKVILALIQRGRALGYDHLCVEEIYEWNAGSKRCFERLGFVPAEKTKKGSSYRLAL